ncbi:MAG: restriction endonuclease subunit S [Deltaproteobacteria bacterium]|nr:restriction endonuclease subunit S [Deltaproteobacteria bacterium]
MAEINPTESLNKGKVAKYVAMESIEPFTRRISNSELKEFQGGMKFRNGDTLFARITPCLENGKTSFVDILENDEIGFGSTEFIVFREKESLSDKKFLYYLLLSPKLREIAVRLMTGSSGRQRVQTNLFVNENFIIPSLTEQRAIAAVLSSLDDKIELLREQNKTLEAIAQAIFKRWFIDFEFPDKNSNPYKSSGGKMVYNEELGKEIPEGWNIGKLREIINSKRKKNIDWKQQKLIALNYMTNFSMCIDNFGQGLELKTNIYELDEYDLLYGSIRPYFGKAGFSPISGAVAGTVFQFIPNKKEYFSFALLVLTGKEFINYTIANSKGTKMPIIGKDDILDYTTSIPPKGILDRFNTIIISLVEQIKNNISQIQTLSALRDSLLPKLISGKIRVPTTPPFGRSSFQGEELGVSGLISEKEWSNK